MLSGMNNNMTIGNHVDFAWGVLITTAGGVNIGDRVLIGYGTACILLKRFLLIFD